MREMLIELVKPFVSNFACEQESGTCELTDCRTCNARVLADHLLANGVIVSPCKVGQTVYEIQPIRHRIESYEISTKMWNGHYWWFTWVLKNPKGIYGNLDGFCCKQIGKTVFLTREEAEEALEKMKGDQQ